MRLNRFSVGILCVSVFTLMTLFVFYFSRYAARHINMTELREVAVAPIYSVRVVKRFKQKLPVFVQGLYLHGDRLYTSSGLYGKSFLRMSNLHSGKVIKQIAINKKLFAEGVTLFNHKMYQLFWKSGRGFIYNYPAIQKISDFPVTGEGWGITHDKHYLIVSDGSSVLSFLDPQEGFKTVRKIQVHDGDRVINRLNDLSYFAHTLYANVWFLDAVAMISPKSGKVIGWIDLSHLHPEQDKPSPGCAVANGVTVSPLSGNLIVTGKCWRHLYEVSIRR